MEERLLALETKAAYQEKELADLSDVLYRQQQKLDALEKQVRNLTQQLDALGESDQERFQKPPHY